MRDILTMTVQTHTDCSEQRFCRAWWCISSPAEKGGRSKTPTNIPEVHLEAPSVFVQEVLSATVRMQREKHKGTLSSQSNA